MDRVKFVNFHGEITAVFPDIPWNRSGDVTCYAHVGQHGPCSNRLMRCRPATKSEAAELLAELKRLGYDDLHVMNTWARDRFELRTVDAWAEPDGGWVWNESRHVGYLDTFSRNVRRAFRRAVRRLGWDYGRSYAVQYDGDVYELVDRKSGKPVFACLYVEGGAE